MTLHCRHSNSPSCRLEVVKGESKTWTIGTGLGRGTEAMTGIASLRRAVLAKPFRLLSPLARDSA